MAEKFGGVDWSKRSAAERQFFEDHTFAAMAIGRPTDVGKPSNAATVFGYMGESKAPQHTSILRGETSGKDTGQQNAMRHTLWAAFSTQATDEATARQALSAHEDNKLADLTTQIFKSYAAGDMAVDYRNNEIGYQLMKQNPGASRKDLAAAAAKEFKDKGLWVLKETPQGYVASREKMTQQQYDSYMKGLQNKDDDARWK